MPDLRLKKDGKEIVLQQDKRLPRSRGLGVHDYRLEAVVTYKTSLLVAVSYAQPGFEGPDTNQVFVATQLP